MIIKEFAEIKLTSTKWLTAHFLKKLTVVIFCILFIPLILISLTFDLLGNLFSFIHKLLDNLFSVIYDLNKPFIIALFTTFGFRNGQIYLGDKYSRESVIKLKEVAKNNGIQCYIIEEMYRIEDGYFVRVIVSREIDLNLLKLIFNTTVKDNQLKNIF